MKKVLGKLTGLSIVLAMVFNLFMPMMVSAAKKITFDPNGGKFSDGKTEAQSVTAQGNNATKEEIEKYFNVTKDNSRFDGWLDGDGAKYRIMQNVMDKNIGGADLALTAQWIDQVKLTIKYFEIFDDGRQEPMNMDKEFTVDKDKKVSEQQSDEVKKAVTAECVGESYELEKVWNYTDVNNPENVPNAQNFAVSADTTLYVLLKKKHCTVTAHSNTQPEVQDVVSEITVEHGKKLSDYPFNPAVSKPGYNFLGWYLEKECKNIFSVDEPITEDKAIFAKWGKAYTIVEGANATIDIRKGMDLVLKADADLSKFAELRIDDKVVAETNYTKTSGSTIITLKASYLTTLADGEHTIKFVYTDGEASTKFTIVKGDVTPDVNPDVNPDKKSDDKSPANVEPSSNGGSSNGGSLGGGSLGGGSYGSGPKTGDAGIAMWGILLSASLVGAAASIKRFRKVK
jgi:uncharacterized membrane protein YgcG